MTVYTNASNIAAYLGTTLDAGQQAQAAVVAQAVSDWIDQQINRSWQQATPVTDELHTLSGDRVYLSNRPVATITSVKTRAAAFVGYGWTTLDASQYELLDAQRGVLLIQGWSASSSALVRVSYTHTGTTPPAEIGLAATILAADLLAPTLNPDAANAGDIASIALGQNDINIKYATGESSTTPLSRAVTNALSMIRGRRMPVIA